MISHTQNSYIWLRRIQKFPSSPWQFLLLFLFNRPGTWSSYLKVNVIRPSHLPSKRTDHPPRFMVVWIIQSVTGYLNFKKAQWDDLLSLSQDSGQGCVIMESLWTPRLKYSFAETKTRSRNRGQRVSMQRCRPKLNDGRVTRVKLNHCQSSSDLNLWQSSCFHPKE